MESLRIKVLWLRSWALLIVVIQQFFLICCAQTSNPCQDFNDVRRVSYGISSFISCVPLPGHMQGQTGSYNWSQNENPLSPQEPNLIFNDDDILGLDFVDSSREGYYDCSYTSVMSGSTVDGTPSPKCIIVRGLPVFQACPDLAKNENCLNTDPPTLFYVGEDLDIPVAVRYVGAGAFGAVFEVTGVSISRLPFDRLMSCRTPLQPIGSDVQFTCGDVHSDFMERIFGNVTTDRRNFVDASFVINSTSVNDTGEYTVRVTARDMMVVTNTFVSPSITTTDTTWTTLTMMLSASATSMPSASSPITLTPTASLVQTTPTSSPFGMDGSPVGTEDDVAQQRIIIIVSVVGGISILAIFLGIVAICLHILHGVGPKLKKQLMENVHVTKMKQNGRDDITVTTEGTTTQNAKLCYQPEYVENCVQTTV